MENDKKICTDCNREIVGFAMGMPSIPGSFHAKCIVARLSSFDYVPDEFKSLSFEEFSELVKDPKFLLHFESISEDPTRGEPVE